MQNPFCKSCRDNGTALSLAHILLIKASPSYRLLKDLVVRVVPTIVCAEYRFGLLSPKQAKNKPAALQQESGRFYI
ncbi:hypothetical protein GCM10023183_06430 [Nibribacter koreensis]|uniref:Uncharacterized protein n=1 Tax=Nibribacter koreensis TaxID=1084519 RepID=A0ABP8F9B4_9BACT